MNLWYKIDPSRPFQSCPQLLSVEEFSTLDDAEMALVIFVTDHNWRRIHGADGMSEFKYCEFCANKIVKGPMKAPWKDDNGEWYKGVELILAGEDDRIEKAIALYDKMQGGKKRYQKLMPSG